MHDKSELRSYQNRLATTFYETSGHLAVVPMGGGKTVASLTAVQELIADKCIRHSLIIAPRRVIQLVWPDEIKLWSHTKDLNYALLDGDPRQRAEMLDTAHERDLTLIGIDHVQWLCEALAKLPDDHCLFDYLILDETSRFRNPKSKRAKALIDQAKRFRNIIGLTGTPRPNGIQDLFKPLQIITRNKLWGRSYWSWLQKRFYPTDYERRNWAIKPDWEQRTNEEAATVCSTLSPEDMPELPELNVIEHFVDMPHAAWEVYDEMEKRLFTSLGGGIEAASMGVATGKLCQAAQGFMYGNDGIATTLHKAKREWIEGMVEDLAGDPAIIIYEFHEDLAVLKELFGDDLPYLGQGVSDKTAAKHVDDWNAKRLPLFAIHPAAGGHGLNLGAGGHQMLFYGLPWSAELYEQVLKRIHRSGQTEHCFVHICLARETIDILKQYRVLHKMSMQEAFKKYLRKI